MHALVRPRQRSYENRGWGWLQMIGRIETATPVAAVRTGLDRVATDLHDRFDPRGSERTAYVTTPAHLLPESHREAILPILGSTFVFTLLLLVVTCANLAGLMHARLLARAREVAIRYSLGSSRRQLMRLWLLESLALAAMGGALGLVLARGTTWLLSRVQPPAQIAPELPVDIPFDWHVVGFTILVSIASALVFGWAPAVRAARLQPVDALKDVGGTSTGGPRQARLRRLAVTLQVSISVTLLVTSALLVRSLWKQQRFDPGFETDRLGLVALDLVNQRIPEAEVRATLALALERIRQVPGVTHASAGLVVPLGFSSERRGLRIPGYTPANPQAKGIVSVDYNIVDAEYFVTMGIPIVSGRSWEPSTSAQGAREVVINETMARRFWAGRNSLGQPVELVGQGSFVVAGIARDITYYEIGEAPRPYIYFPDRVLLDFQPKLHVRTAGPAEPVLPAVERLVRAVDPRFAPSGSTTFLALRQAPLFPGRALATSALAFGLIALALTAVGLYGVVAASVGQRTREIGVRMALGAEARVVLREMLRDALRLTGAGAAVGFAGAYLTASAMRSLLFQVGPFDGVAYLLVGTVIATTTIAAAWVPARRAASIDPVVALK